MEFHAVTAATWSAQGLRGQGSVIWTGKPTRVYQHIVNKPLHTICSGVKSPNQHACVCVGVWVSVPVITPTDTLVRINAHSQTGSERWWRKWPSGIYWGIKWPAEKLPCVKLCVTHSGSFQTYCLILLIYSLLRYPLHLFEGLFYPERCFGTHTCISTPQNGDRDPPALC